jgi:hypothetical protein
VVADILGQPITSIFKDHALKEEFLDCLILEDGIDRLSQNVSNKLPLYAAEKPTTVMISKSDTICSVTVHTHTDRSPLTINVTTVSYLIKNCILQVYLLYKWN